MPGLKTGDQSTLVCVRAYVSAHASVSVCLCVCVCVCARARDSDRLITLTIIQVNVFSYVSYFLLPVIETVVAMVVVIAGGQRR